MNALTDSRLGKFSASEFERVMACDGYPQLKRLVEAQRVQVDKESAAAKSGTELHALNESGDTSDATYTEEELVVKIRQREEEFCRQWCADMDVPFEKIAIIREKRFWFDVDRVSAQLDTLILWEDRALIIDAKSGRLPVPPPVRNWQGRVCAVAAVSELGFKHVRFAIANVWGSAMAPVDYDNEDLNRIAIMIRKRLEAVELPGREFKVGEWCRYCPCLHACPGQREQMQVAIQNRTINWSVLRPEDKKPLFIAAKMAVDAGTAILQQIKADLANDPACAPGLSKKPDGSVRKITDAKKASLALHAEVGGHDIDVMRAVLEKSSISLENFVTLYRDATGASKADAEKWLETHCSTFIEKQPRSGSVVIEKET